MADAKEFSGSETDRPEALRHEPVLLEQILAFLRPRPKGRYLDATLGGGGHSLAILEQADGCEIVGFDRDSMACSRAGERLSPFGDRMHIVHGGYEEFASALEELGWETVDGIIADLGLSSLQLADQTRGFSFRGNGKLDMRFDPSRGETAAELVNRLDEVELAKIIYEFGEERRSRAIARRIVAQRAQSPIETTEQLRQIVRASYGKPSKGRNRPQIDPATRTFQALRIAVNDELGRLETFLTAAPSRLAVGGRLAILSYHSLEDRLVKWGFRDLVADCEEQDADRAYSILTKKPLMASEEETARNPRSRSAKLRVLERVR